MASYNGAYFGANNFPPGCTRERGSTDPRNVCFHMKDLSGINPLDSTKIDVLILVPLGPTAERDMRIERQAVAMWDEGIHYLAPKMGLPWLNQVEFRVSTDYVDLDNPQIPPSSLVDPEIVIIGANPSAGTGAGLDPLNFVGLDGVPCAPLERPFDLSYWQSLPGFQSHHSPKAGTYSEACGGQGGHVCMVVNGSQDPNPAVVDWFDSFWLTSHEFGHCLTIGHLGDGGEGRVNGEFWGPVPYQEIMNYEGHGDTRSSIGGPPSYARCASTLDVEVFALRMSHFLDVNGDGHVGPDDVRVANDQVGSDDGGPMQVQHPSDYFYASPTGLPQDCPQPDLGAVPGKRPSWTPKPVNSLEAVLDVDEVEGQVVSGTVSERSLFDPPAPTATSVTQRDDPGDATTAYTEIQSVTATASDTTLDAVIQVKKLYPLAQGSQFSYSLVVNGMRLDSFVLDPKKTEPQPLLSDGWEYVGSTEWDVANGRVLIHVPRSLLRSFAISAPYQLSAIANYAGTVATAVHDDWAPEQGKTFGVAAPPERVTVPADNPSADDDRDGVADASDRCPLFPGLGADGCTSRTPSQVRVLEKGSVVGSQDVYADHGPDRFAIPVDLDKGTHTLVVEWLDRGTLLARTEVRLKVA
jgi:hypothetical protein